MSKYSDLAEKLLKAHKFRSHADAEVVVEEAAAALRELGAENEGVWREINLLREINARLDDENEVLEFERSALKKDCEEACEDRAMVYAKNARLRELLRDAELSLDPDTDMALVVEIRDALRGEGDE